VCHLWGQLKDAYCGHTSWTTHANFKGEPAQAYHAHSDKKKYWVKFAIFACKFFAFAWKCETAQEAKKR